MICTLISRCQKSPRNLNELYTEFLEVANLRNILALLQQKQSEGDPDFVASFEYLKSDRFRSIGQFMFQTPEFVDVSRKRTSWVITRPTFLESGRKPF